MPLNSSRATRQKITSQIRSTFLIGIASSRQNQSFLMSSAPSPQLAIATPRHLAPTLARRVRVCRHPLPVGARFRMRLPPARTHSSLAQLGLHRLVGLQLLSPKTRLPISAQLGLSRLALCPAAKPQVITTLCATIACTACHPVMLTEITRQRCARTGLRRLSAGTRTSADMHTARKN